ncbi:MAG: protein kinase [Solidesulfovibrio sp.]
MDNLEGYDIIEKIGEGGMGQVYKAVHRRLDRSVAIKRLAPHLSQNQDMLKRFLQEARLQARLPHPNVVSIFDLIENEQGVFLIMEYVEGQTAKEMLLGRGQLSLAEALMIAEGVLNGLAFMHRNGVVHRDIKPSNIMVSVAGTVKVTDFGIARLVDEETGLTRFGGGIGTLHYMAPELIKSGEVSFAIDIYSLGATLHELLSGTPPFTGNTDLEIMMGHLERVPQSLDHLAIDDVGRACRDLVAKALAKAPADRFDSAESFLGAVRKARALLGHESPQAAAPISRSGTAPLPQTPTMATPGHNTAVTRPPADEALTVAGGLERAAATGQTATPPTTGRKPRRAGLFVALGAAALLGLLGYLALRPTPAPIKDTAAVTPAPKDQPGSTTAIPAKGEQPEPVDARQAAPNAEVASATPAVSATPTTQGAPATAAPAQGKDAAPRAATEQTVATPPAATPPAATTAAGPTSPPTSTGPAETGAPMADQIPAAPILPGANPAAAHPTANREAAPAAEPAPASNAPPASQAPVDDNPPAKSKASETPAPPAAATKETVGVVYVRAKDARLREQPNATGNVLKFLDIDTKLIVIQQDGEWIRATEPGGRTGYIRQQLTTPDRPAPSGQSVPAAPAAQSVPAAPAAPATTPPKPAKPAARHPAEKPAEGGPSGWRIVK